MGCCHRPEFQPSITLTVQGISSACLELGFNFLLADSRMPFIGLNRLALPQRVARSHKVSVHLKLSQTDLGVLQYCSSDQSFHRYPSLLAKVRWRMPEENYARQRDWLGWNLSPQNPIRKKGILKPSTSSAHKQKYPQTMMRKMILLSLIYRFPLGTLLLILILEANKFSSTLPQFWLLSQVLQIPQFTQSYPNKLNNGFSAL